MWIESVSISGVRNLQTQTLRFSAGTNLLIGRNGQGKTNCVEALYALGSGRSFRTAHLSELIAQGQENATIAGSIRRQRTDSDISLSLELKTKKKPSFLLNGKESALTQGYLGKLITVTFNPNDVEIIRAGPSARRKFLDKHIIDVYPSYLTSLLRYQRALKSKEALLDEDGTSASDLRPWNVILAQEGAEITKRRLQFVTELFEAVNNVLPLVAPDDGGVTLALKSPHLEEERDASEYLTVLESLAAREIRLRKTLAGPHRDDLEIILGTLSARDFASQGQARTLTLLLKLAVIELSESKTGESPVVLLDDVDSELDEQRARFLFNEFSRKERQVFITTTTQAQLWPGDTKTFRVSNGVVQEEGSK